MKQTDNHNWQKEALDFLIHLSPIKDEKDILVIRSKTTNLLQIHTCARAAALVRLDDDITARVLYATEKCDSFLDAAMVKKIVECGRIEEADHSHKNLFPGINILFPVQYGLFSGLFIIATDIAIDAEYRQLFQHAWVGLKDITRLTQTYYSFDHLSTRFNAILGTIDEAVVFVDDSGKDGWLNSSASRLLNIGEGRQASVDIAVAMQQLRQSAINVDEIAQVGARLFNQPGQTIKDWKWIYGNPVSKVLSVSCIPTISANIKGRLWVFTDITAIHLLNDELAEKRKLADEQNKAKSDFLANMSHEIRTPMNGVIGMTSLLANTPLNEEQKDYLDTIRLSGESLLAIINDILDFSKIESGKMDLEEQALRISNVIEETFDLLSVKANDKGLDLLYFIEPNVPNEIIGDIIRIRQILVNLVSNGLKFTEKGEIFISVNAIGFDEGVYTLEFTVKDTGIGIPADKYHKLFESFSQVDSSTTRKYGGTGLGLAICQRLVTLMGGSIRVESEYGKGSAFIFTIKTAANTRKIQYNTQHRADLSSLKDKAILVLDDNSTNLKILNKQCQLWGMKPTVCSNHTLALESIDSTKFDVAIIDMLMPDVNGIDIAAIIKQKQPNLPLILFSSAGYIPANDERIKLLFAAVVNKPVKHNQMEDVLISIMSKKGIKQQTSGVQIQTATDALPINILVAEDDEINQKLIRRALEKLGYNFDIVDNGKLAVESVANKKYQLVFMDVMMPEMDGYEAARIITDEHPTHKPIIVALTANALTGDKEKILANGMDDYISKPYKIQDIKDVILKWEKDLMNML